MLAVLYAAAPNVRHGGFRWISPGAALAVVIWLAASGLFAVYVANFASYNKTYGSLAGVIVFLVWLWISNLAILLGVEFDAELEHERALREGVPAGQPSCSRIPKDTRKFDDAETREAEQVNAARHPEAGPIPPPRSTRPRRRSAVDAVVRPVEDAPPGPAGGPARRSAARAAFAPGAPCTPPPGWADALAR